MEIIKHCPVCEAQHFKKFLKGKDHFLTGEEFTIVECTDCGFRFTNPRPDAKEILRYYDSPDYMAHDTGKQTLVQAIYTTVRKINLRNKYSIVKKNSTGKALMDIGCGTGEFLNYCMEKALKQQGLNQMKKPEDLEAKILD